jgi:hypothetical protein
LGTAEGCTRIDHIRKEVKIQSVQNKIDEETEVDKPFG